MVLGPNCFLRRKIQIRYVYLTAKLLDFGIVLFCMIISARKWHICWKCDICSLFFTFSGSINFGFNKTSEISVYYDLKIIHIFKVTLLQCINMQ